MAVDTGRPGDALLQLILRVFTLLLGDLGDLKVFEAFTPFGDLNEFGGGI